MSWEEFMNMDVQEVTNAIRYSEMPKAVVDDIWVQHRSAFEVFD